MSNAWFEAAPPLLPEVLALNARWLGNQPAVICDEATLTWSTFHVRCCQLANGLLAQGLKRGDRVAVLMDNSSEMMIVLFGIIIAGGVTVPLNTMVARPGLEAMIEDCEARFVFVSEHHAPTLAPLQDKGCAVASDGWFCTGVNSQRWAHFNTWIDRQDHTDPQVQLADEDECNIIYSSGTTGQPKGIVHTHRRRLDWFYDLAIALRYDRASINLCSIGLFSNISWAGMGCTLLTGGTVVVMPTFEASDWLETVARHRVTHSAMVPVQFQRILEAPGFSDFDVSSIKSLMCCGSPLSPELKGRVMDRLAPQLVELYGLTEGIITTLEPEHARERMASVGKPLPGTDLLILDDQDQPCPAGVSGEIVGRGRILMAGYHNRPDANDEATFTDSQGRRWLRTGDIGMLDEAGFLYLKDRKKDLIISGGQNIYPADIENVLQQHPAVSEASVIGIDNPRWGESPLALVVAADGALDALQLREWVNQQVGKHQRLVGVEFVAELPRNPNGKILKRTLRAQYRNWLDQQGESAA